MFRIRFYDKVFHPDELRGSFLGWRIRLVNWLRWKLEVCVQRQMVKWLAKQHSVEPKKRSQLLKMFELDVRAENLQAEATSPRVLQFTDPDLPAEFQPRSSRYEEASFSKAIDKASGLPVRPTPINDLAARFGSPERQRRYARGRSKFLVNDENEIEPVAATNPSWRKHG